MPDLRSLPPGCILRLASDSDKHQIQALLSRLEQELVPHSLWWRRFWQRGLWSIAIALTTLRIGLYFVGAPHYTSSPKMSLLLLLGWGGSWIVNAQREWHNYWVVDCAGQIVACAKLQPFKLYTVLYDLYVLPDWRKQGLGSYIVSHLAQIATHPLYLACYPPRLSFYQRLGFTPVPPARLSTLLRYDLGLPGRPDVIPLVTTPLH